MKFGPLEMQSCGENNFTMKALGLLAFREDLRARLIRNVFGVSVGRAEASSILFFSRIGEGFFREAIEREARARDSRFEERLNQALGLPPGFRWRRNTDGRLTQPAKWQDSHVLDMLRENGRAGDQSLRHRLSYLQDCINTEPDLVLQWGGNLAIIEVKVLSGEGMQQLDRQRDLGKLIADVLGWRCHLAFIGPEHGGRPSTAGYTLVSWSDIARHYEDVPEIRDYVNKFAFYYHGSWQSMVARYVDPPAETAFDLFMKRPPTRVAANAPRTQPAYDPTAASRDQGPTRVDPWHFSHLGREYFQRLNWACKGSGHVPIRYVWTGKTGVPYAERSAGRAINANWMVETANGTRRTNGKRESYDAARMWRWAFQEIADHFKL
jgi:hypothetical protein